MKKFAIPIRDRIPNFPLNVDFMPVMSLQSELDKKQELYKLKAHVTVVDTKRIESKEKTYGDLKARIIPLRGNHIKVSYGSIDPFDSIRMTKKEIWNDIQNHLAVPEAVISSCGTVHNVPDKLQNEVALESSNKIFVSHISQGNRYGRMTRQLRVKGKQTYKIANPYQIIRHDLLSRGIISSISESVLKRIKGFTSTEYILPDNKRGYDQLSSIAMPLQRELRKGKFFKDTAMPLKFSGAMDSTSARMILYQLDDRRDKIITL